MSKQKRFVPLKGHRGIRKDTLTGRYVARKYIDGKSYCEMFGRVSDAQKWRRNFHPLVTKKELKHSNSETLCSVTQSSTRLNGVEQRFTLKEIWELYRRYYFPTLERQSIAYIERFAQSFYSELMPLKMQQITSEVIDAFMEGKVREAKRIKNVNRCNFNKDLGSLKSLLNWYRENYDGTFIVPIFKRHLSMGVIKKAPPKNLEKMAPEQVKLFLNSFSDPFWQDFAELHFFMAARVQEVGGLQWTCIDFQKEMLRVEDVAVWDRVDKKFNYLKEIPKNGERRVVHLNGRMLDLLKRRWEKKSRTSCRFKRPSTGEKLDFVFEIAGGPVSYRSIQYQYNKVLKAAKLHPKFSSTHILRKAMANIVRQELGLDAAQASGGWKTRDIVEKTYTNAPNTSNKAIVEHVEGLLADS